MAKSPRRCTQGLLRITDTSRKAGHGFGDSGSLLNNQVAGELGISEIT